MPDNVAEMKERLLDYIPKELHVAAMRILHKNIKCHDALTWDFDNWKAPAKAKILF